MKRKTGKPRTYELSQDLIDEIDETSRQLDVYQSHLVQALLTDAVARLKRGELKLKTAPIPHSKFRTRRLT